ncbi:LexA family protein [Pseudomonas asuensis]|nr:translesion error-prone DNA polymerase V autoproteolytic subunit [Pseudomonas asuensis]
MQPLTVTFLGPLLAMDLTLPFYGYRVPAGFPSPAQDHLEERISLDQLLDIQAPHTYLVRAHGDSMIGSGIYDGDLLVVDRSVDAVPGDVIIAAINGEPVVKRLGYIDTIPALISDNPLYKPRLILEGDDFEVWGVVRCSLRTHRGHV